MEELRRRIEEAEARTAEEKARLAVVEAQIMAAEARRAEAEARRAEAEARRDAIEAWIRRTTFLEYMRGVEEHLYETSAFKHDSRYQPKTGATSVLDKFYPQHFRPWTDFEATHAETFRRLVTAFQQERCFRSFYMLEEAGHDLRSDPMNKLDLQPFVWAAIEKPAVMVVSKYLERTNDTTYASVHFRNNYGLLPPGEEDVQLAAEAAEAAEDAAAAAIATQPGGQSADNGDEGRLHEWRSPTKYGVADQRLYAHYRNPAEHGGRQMANVLAGEYKAAHALTPETLARVMQMPPGDDFFVRATANEAVRKADGKPWVEGSMFVATVLCQAFHYMVTSGVEYGYVAAGDGLVFLRVPENDPNTLYYYWSVFPVGRDDENVHRPPEETAAAYLVTLCLCALQSQQRPLSWTDSLEERNVQRWPAPNAAPTNLSDMPVRLLPHGRDDEGGGDGEGLNVSSQQPQQQQQQQQRQWVVEPPTLPYCSQACLRGLCRGQPLDEGCLNVALHRAAAAERKMAGNRHPLTAAEVRTRIAAQLAANVDKDAECLDVYGCFGRFGVLFKLAVTGFGYTFVGKAVHRINRYKLDYEVTVYEWMQAFQGVLMPVCMGMLELARPVMLHSGTSVAYMMLLSHAGPDLGQRRAVPADVDMEAEAWRTVQELSDAGLEDHDDRDVNMTWNAEAGRVMRIDFGEARLYERQAPCDVAEEAKPAVRSPLATKRDANTVAVEPGPATKRARAEEDASAAKRARVAL